jgi:hypothetical protein
MNPQDINSYKIFISGGQKQLEEKNNGYVFVYFVDSYGCSRGRISKK